MIRSVVREYKWSPSVIGDLYFDSEDYKGLIFWYEDIVQVHKELEPKIKK